MSVTNTFNFFFALNYFAKSSLYQCIVPSQPMFNTVLLVQIKIISLVQISCFPRLFYKKRVSNKIVSILFYKTLFIRRLFFVANCLFYILSLCLKCLLFQIRTHGIRMHVSIRTGVEKGQIRGYKNVGILLKEVLLKLNLKHKGHVFTDCLLDILDNYCKHCLF